MSSDDKWIAACNLNGNVLLWERAKGKEFHRFQIDSRYVGYVAFSPDSNRLVYGGE